MNMPHLLSLMKNGQLFVRSGIHSGSPEQRSFHTVMIGFHACIDFNTGMGTM